MSEYVVIGLNDQSYQKQLRDLVKCCVSVCVAMGQGCTMEYIELPSKYLTVCTVST